MLGVVIAISWDSIITLATPLERPTNTSPTITQHNSEPSQTLWVALEGEEGKKQISHGESVSKRVCVTCHIRPDPDILDADSWGRILPEMAPWLGLEPPRKRLKESNTNGFERVMTAGIIPKDPLLTETEWNDLIVYYLKTAPKELRAPKHSPLSIDLNLFEPIKPKKIFSAAVMTIRVNHSKGGLWVAHEPSDKLYQLDPEYEWLPKPRQFDSSPATLVPTQDGILAPLIGTFMPSFQPQGELVRFKGDKIESLAGILHRPTDVLPLDLNQDGREDLAVTEHGNWLGSVFWLEKTERGYKRHTLLDLPGALNFASGHFNDDNIPDLVILTGQAREAVHLFLSTGPGEFKHRMILMRHPAWGHSHIEVVDFNKDDYLDLLITNGDNGELNNFPPKPYHGIRLHLNDGKNNFNEALFFPQYGAYRAVAKDFDGDGDLDIASIAFFGKYDISPDTSFVYLQQDKPLKFSAHTLPASRSGRWLTMDAGDIDKDGDIDIALGAYNDGPTPKGIPPQMAEKWKNNPVPVLILKNRTK
jgi:hypothetical protein